MWLDRLPTSLPKATVKSSSPSKRVPSEQLKNKDYPGALSTWRPNQSEASAVVDRSNRYASIVRAFVFNEMTI